MKCIKVTLIVVSLHLSTLSFSAEGGGEPRPLGPPRPALKASQREDSIIFYRDGNDIVVLNCGPTEKEIQRRFDCAIKGQENRVPIESFKSTMMRAFDVSDPRKLKPLTYEEALALRSIPREPESILSLHEKDLERLVKGRQEWIGRYAFSKGRSIEELSKEDPYLKDSYQDLLQWKKELGEVQSKLNALRAHKSARQKLDDLLNSYFSASSGPNNVHRLTEGADRDSAIFTALRQFDAAMGECGTDEILNGTSRPRENDGKPHDGGGSSFRASWLIDSWVPSVFAGGITLDDRIKNCKSVLGSARRAGRNNVEWNLVARKRDSTTGKFHEVWKDSRTGLIWGDVLEGKSSFHNAVEFSSIARKVVREKACLNSNPEAKKANAGVNEKSFGLPTDDEFVKATANGLLEIAPNMAGYNFWTSTPHSYDLNRVSPTSFSSLGTFSIFSGTYGVVGSYSKPETEVSVRCVGR